MRKILPFIIILSAISVSASAAFYSVYGLSRLFSGASFEVIIMASSLEVSKLVIATLLHEYWSDLNKLLKFYLTIAVLILVMITSAGIYGFLSSAYQETASVDLINDRKIELVDTKLNLYKNNLYTLNSEKDVLLESITELRTALSNPNTIQYVDKNTNQLVTTTSSSARKSLEKQLDDATSNRSNIDSKIGALNDSITSLEINKIEMMNSSESSSELGPLKYISSISGLDMDVVVNYFLLLIIFVFDPLAISLVLAANFAVKQIGKNDGIGVIQSDNPPVTAAQVKPVSNVVEETFEKVRKKKIK